MSALTFAVLAMALAGPIPAVLARAAWPMRAPRAAVVLWQSIAAAAVLSAFSSGLAIGGRLLVADEIPRLGWPLWFAQLAIFALTLLIGARLLATVLQVGIATRRRRAHHRMLVDLLGDSPRGANGLRVLHVSEPLAYCLPGVRSRVVLSEGTFSALSDAELHAILSHERAHLRARHDLVLEAFVALHTAFPRFVRSGSALHAVSLLVELLADDAAVRAAGPRPLARALVTCAAGPAPSGALAAGGPTTLVRVRRLNGRPNSLCLSLAAYGAAVAVLVVPTVAFAIPWLAELHRLFLAHYH